MYQRLSSKFIKNNFLVADDFLCNFVPDYVPYSLDNLKSMLSKYPVIFIKPDSSMGAKGVLKVERTEDDLCKVSDADKNSTMLPIDKFPKWLSKFHIIQKGIISCMYEGKSLELRVYLQRLNNQWEIMGVIPKVAKLDTFSPTLNRGGTSHFFNDIFPNDDELLSKIHYLSKRIGDVMQDNLPGLMEMGLDLGIDAEKKLWVFEVNTAPDTVTFKPLDTDLFKKVVRNKKQIVMQTKEYTLEDILPKAIEKKSGCRQCGKKDGFRGLKKRG